MSEISNTKDMGPVGEGAARRQPAGTGAVSALLRAVRGHAHLLILLLPVVLVVIPFWPGHMNNDTLNQISEAITGDLTNYHASLLVAMWHVVWGLGVGPGWVLLLQVACFVSGAYLLLRIPFGRIAATIATIALAMVPQVYGQLGLLGRDTWYIAFLLLAAGSLAYGFAAREPRSRPVRLVSIFVSLSASWLAMAARQNAITSVVVVIAAILVLLLMPRWPRLSSPGWRAISGLALVALGSIAVALALFASQSGLRSLIGVKNVHPEQYIYDFDLAGMSTREHRDLFPHSIVPPSRLPDVERLFTVDNVIPEILAPGAPLPSTMLPARQVAKERKAEIRAVEDAPLTWLGIHWDEFVRQISINRRPYIPLQPPLTANSLGMSAKFPSLDRTATAYVEAFDPVNGELPEGSFIERVWIYLLITILGCWLLLRRWRDPGAFVLGALALSSITYQAGVFVSMGVEYRLEMPSVVIGIIVLFSCARMLISGRLAQPVSLERLRPRRHANAAGKTRFDVPDQ